MTMQTETLLMEEESVVSISWGRDSFKFAKKL